MHRPGSVLLLVLMPLGAATAQDGVPPTCGYAAAQAEERAERERRTLAELLESERGLEARSRDLRLLLLERIVALEPPPEAQDPLSRATLWLAAQQDSTGRWGAGLEADALAAAALFHGRSAARLVELARLRVQVHGAVDPGDGPVESRVLSIVLWVRTLLDPDPFRTAELRSRLYALRHADGTWRDPAATRWALLALGKRPDALAAPRTLEERFLAVHAPPGREERATLRRATKARLLATQRPDGSWAEGDDESLPARVRATALAVLCLTAR